MDVIDIVARTYQKAKADSIERGIDLNSYKFFIHPWMLEELVIANRFSDYKVFSDAVLDNQYETIFGLKFHQVAFPRKETVFICTKDFTNNIVNSRLVADTAILAD